MYADDSYATAPYATAAPIGEPIIEEVGVETAELVFVVEIDVVQIAGNGS